MRNVFEDLKHTALCFVHVAKQHRPAKSAIQNHEHWRQDRRGAIAQQLLTKAVQHTDQSHAHDPVFDEHGIAQTRTDADEHCRDEVGEKRISKARARKRRIFGRKVLTVDKARDDADMEGKIAIVIQYAGVKTFRFLQ